MRQCDGTGSSTVYTLSIGTPYLLTILVLKFEIVRSTMCLCVYNIYGKHVYNIYMANSVDPDQIQCSANLTQYLGLLAHWDCVPGELMLSPSRWRQRLSASALAQCLNFQRCA